VKTLIAGPWVGEFGWELFAWQGYLRALAPLFDKIVCVSTAGHEILYKDFCDEFISHNISRTGPSDAFFMHNYTFCIHDLGYKKQSNEELIFLFPCRIGWPPLTHFLEKAPISSLGSVVPQYITYGKNQSKDIDLIFHARSRREIRPEDNWSLENWKKISAYFKNLGYNIACIGSQEEAFWVEGTQDFRGKNLEEITDYLASAKAIIGPSSGPMHLASLCKCPQVVWSIDNNKRRYEINWNPHKSPVSFFSKYKWHPPVEYVIKKTEALLDRTNMRLR
tara:strand:- start:12666 stop:13499 length:834 start_codon:yes stop_codon:yes gene_type:complete